MGRREAREHAPAPMSEVVVLSGIGRGADTVPVSVAVSCPGAGSGLVLAAGAASAAVPGCSPESAGREIGDRVRSAVISSGFRWPQSAVVVQVDERVRIDECAGLGLPIALGVLAASGQIPAEPVGGCRFVGELAADGGVGDASGVLAAAVGLAGAADVDGVVVTSARAAGHARSVGEAVATRSLGHCVDALDGAAPWARARMPASSAAGCPLGWSSVQRGPASRAAVAAAAGGHHLMLLDGLDSEGVVVAQSVHGLLGDLSPDQDARAAAVQDACGLFPAGGRPLRAPHHTGGWEQLLGSDGGGEIAAARHGVLLLCRLEEFGDAALDNTTHALRTGAVEATVGGWLGEAPTPRTLRWPADAVVVATTTPCECGFGPEGCVCSAELRTSRRRQIPGPMWDLFGLQAQMAVHSSGRAAIPPMSWAQAVAAVAHARERAKGRGATSNAALSRQQLRAAARVTDGAEAMLREQTAAGGLSERGGDHAVAVALTLCDLTEGSSVIDERRLEDAISLHRDQPSFARAEQDRRAADVETSGRTRSVSM